MTDYDKNGNENKKGCTILTFVNITIVLVYEYMNQPKAINTQHIAVWQQEPLSHRETKPTTLVRKHELVD